jgi:hypothetical protein
MAAYRIGEEEEEANIVFSPVMCRRKYEIVFKRKICPVSRM